MQNVTSGRIYTQQLNIRLRPEEKQALENRATEAGKRPGEWSREALLDSCEVAPQERRRLVLLAIGNEINRLTLIALYNQEDISSEAFQQRIEQQARASAEVNVERWLRLSSRVRGGL